MIAVIALAGYGSSKPAFAVAGQASSKPAFCSDLTNIENAINAVAKLPNNASQSKLTSAVQKIETDATALIGSAKSDFPSQSNALKSSVSAVKTTVKAYASSSTKANLKAFETALTNGLNKINAFASAVRSKCG